MSPFWKKLFDRFVLRPNQFVLGPNQQENSGPQPGEDRANQPAASPTDVTYRNLPPTFLATVGSNSLSHPRFFDPALRQYQQAFRPGDPSFSDEVQARDWVAIRGLATDYVLRRIAESKWGGQLILRGSRLLKALLGEIAREPGDLDWVVDPSDFSRQDPQSVSYVDGLANVVCEGSPPNGFEWNRSRISVDDIWTYERAPGRRVVFPWQANGLPGGVVQVDFVFGEQLVEPARKLSIVAADGGCISLRVASPAQSLAWKLLWLASDWSPQGKDFYDAVLMAEHFPLPFATLEQTFRLADGTPLPATAQELAMEGSFEWDSFQKEYPWVIGTFDEWVARLSRRLDPVLSRQSLENDEVQRLTNANEYKQKKVEPAWQTDHVMALAHTIRTSHSFGLLPILADALEESGVRDTALLGHFRSRGPHTQGCSMLDRMLEIDGENK